MCGRYDFENTLQIQEVEQALPKHVLGARVISNFLVLLLLDGNALEKGSQSGKLVFWPSSEAKIFRVRGGSLPFF